MITLCWHMNPQGQRHILALKRSHQNTLQCHCIQEVSFYVAKSYQERPYLTMKYYRKSKLFFIQCFPDVDECQVGNHRCRSDQLCFNTKGSHRCIDMSCPTYYTKKIAWVYVRWSLRACSQHSKFSRVDGGRYTQIEIIV